jgi:hypothetical protein
MVNRTLSTPHGAATMRSEFDSRSFDPPLAARASELRPDGKGKRENYLAWQAKYNHSEKGRARWRRYNLSEKGRARTARYEATPARRRKKTQADLARQEQTRRREMMQHGL